MRERDRQTDVERGGRGERGNRGKGGQIDGKLDTIRKRDRQKD